MYYAKCKCPFPFVLSFSFSLCVLLFSFLTVLRFYYYYYYSIVSPLIVFTAAGNSCEKELIMSHLPSPPPTTTPHENSYVSFSLFFSFSFRISTTPSPPYNISCIHAHALTKRYVRNTHGYIIFVMFNSPWSLQFIFSLSCCVFSLNFAAGFQR